MEKFFEDYLYTLDACHNSILETIAGLPAAALDWKPGPEMNSIAVLIYHLTGAERYWIGDVAGETPTGRDRAAEFNVHAVGLDTLKSRLEENLAFVRNVVEKLSLASLAEARTSRDGRSVTVAWALLHAMEHSGIHRGHIEMTRQLWQDSQT
jgi:uncharacterized damage-inducible protein DinB